MLIKLVLYIATLPLFFLFFHSYPSLCKNIFHSSCVVILHLTDYVNFCKHLFCRLRQWRRAFHSPLSTGKIRRERSAHLHSRDHFSTGAFTQGDFDFYVFKKKIMSVT